MYAIRSYYEIGLEQRLVSRLMTRRRHHLDRGAGTLADHFCTQLVAVDPDPVIGPVTHLQMRFIAGLDIGADTTVPVV